jgi:hypothetical protein
MEESKMKKAKTTKRKYTRRAKATKTAKTTKRKYTRKVKPHWEKPYSMEVCCENCGETLDLTDCGFYRGYNKETHKPEFFCNAECCASWEHEEIGGEQIVEDLESMGIKVENKPNKTYRVLYEGEEIATGIEADDEDEALNEVKNNLDVEQEDGDC